MGDSVGVAELINSVCTEANALLDRFAEVGSNEVVVGWITEELKRCLLLIFQKEGELTQYLTSHGIHDISMYFKSFEAQPTNVVLDNAEKMARNLLELRDIFNELLIADIPHEAGDRFCLRKKGVIVKICT